ncbi:uncharacterized protein LOC135825342 [Sycon ciliatum]|uniref:uncharacterized protein LOC135825342 n=1 Tax=Sycon ciliatum TaxID=27933 RepID=UPI0031F661DA
MMLEHRSAMHEMVASLANATGVTELQRQGDILVKQAQLAMQDRLKAHSSELSELRQELSRPITANVPDHQRVIDDLSSDRRLALQRVAELEEEVNDLKLVFILGKKLSQEDELKETIASRTEQVKRDEEIMRKEFERLRKENFELADRLLVAQRERNEVIEERNVAIQRSERLEQVVSVLKKRISAGSAAGEMGSSINIAGSTASLATMAQAADGTRITSASTTHTPTSTTGHARKTLPPYGGTNGQLADGAGRVSSIQSGQSMASIDGRIHLVMGLSPTETPAAAAADGVLHGIIKPAHNSGAQAMTSTRLPASSLVHAAADDDDGMFEHIYATPVDVQYGESVASYAMHDEEDPYSLPFDTLPKSMQLSTSPGKKSATSTVSPYASQAVTINSMRPRIGSTGPPIKPYADVRNAATPETLPVGSGLQRRHQWQQQQASSNAAAASMTSIKSEPVYSVPHKPSGSGGCAAVVQRRMTESALGKGQAKPAIQSKSSSFTNPASASSPYSATHTRPRLQTASPSVKPPALPQRSGTPTQPSITKTLSRTQI